MIAIIAEKPSVAQDIARIVGATEKKNGYLEGNGYLVTWAFGHLVGLALPEFYGHKRGTSNLPIIPEPFTLTIRKKRTDKKTYTDPAASRQMGVIRRVADQCQQIIAATDAGREGELIFRYIYTYLGLTQPVKRLWISSLTEEAIDKGMRNLQDGAAFDGLYRAADCRAKADWLVGINASSALAVASGNPNNSLGRVQTPTLAMVCSRFLENRGFLPSDYWRLYITLQKDGVLSKFRYVEDINDPEKAEFLSGRVKTYTQALIEKVETNRVNEAPPLLYDLTALQKDCNIYHDLSADKTLSAAQSLYEKKLITYPRTGSRYISADIMPGIPSLLRMVMRMEKFAHFSGSMDPLRPSHRSVDASKVTDHHALLITGNYPGELTTAERQVYELICGRMLEAFAPKCEKQTMLTEAGFGGMQFRSRSVEILTPGWRGVYSRRDERSEDDEDIQDKAVEFTQGESVPVMGQSLAKKKTRPRPLYTEATLLAAMETPCQRGQAERNLRAGKAPTDEKAREAVKESGIGTPATRAAIIETLMKREYMERSGKSLIPTDKGLQLYKAVKDLRIADVELTGSWETSLSSIERGEMNTDTFMKAITVYTGQVTAEVLSLDVKQPPAVSIRCPKCHRGNIIIRHKIAKCDNDRCGLVVFRRFLNKQLTDQHLQQLFSSGKTKLIKGFHGKQDKTFDACLKFDKSYNLTFHFPEKKGTAKKNTGKAKPRSGAKAKSGSGSKPPQK